MFVLARMVDNVRIDPFKFGQNFSVSIEGILNKKFANKVVLNVGLCICFYDFEKIGDSFILPGDGASHTKVQFRFVIFRPFIDEILVGRIRACDKNGIHVSIGFFDDIIVPQARLPENSVFNETDQVWIWNYENQPGSTVEMFMESSSEVRIRVVDEEFCDTVPQGPVDIANSEAKVDSTLLNTTEKKASYLIIGSMNEPGLGCLSWWKE